LEGLSQLLNEELRLAVLPEWRAICGPAFRPYGYGCWFDLSENPDEPIHFGRVSVRGGRKAVTELFYRQQEAGISHVVLNLKPTRRDPREILDELGEHVLHLFSPHSTDATSSR